MGPVATAPVADEPALPYVGTYPRTRRRRQNSSAPAVIFFGGIALAIGAVVLMTIKPWEHAPTSSRSAPVNKRETTKESGSGDSPSTDPEASTKSTKSGEDEPSPPDPRKPKSSSEDIGAVISKPVETPSSAPPPLPPSRPAPPAGDVPLKVGKAPVPTTAELLPVRKRIRERYQRDFDEATTLPRKAALAEKLLKDAESEKDDPVARYVQLDEVRKRAIEGGQSSVVVAAIKAMGAHYDFDELEIMTSSLTEVEKVEAFAPDKRKLAEDALAQFELALARGKTEIADRLIAVAFKAASKANDADLLQQIIARRRKFRESST
jgi:hypothetical protein